MLHSCGRMFNCNCAIREGVVMHASLECAYMATMTRGGTTVSRDRHLIAIFADTATYLPLKMHGVIWLLPASAEATQSEDPQRLVVSCT